jgi:hypothetical protein
LPKTHAVGRTLLAAVQELLPTHLQIIAAGMIARTGRAGEEATVLHYQARLWEALAGRLQAGELAATGFPIGAEEPKAIHPAFFNDALCDFELNKVESHGVVYSGVRISETPGAVAAPETPSFLPKRVGGADYRSADMPHLRRMRELITTGEASGPQDAARRVVSEGQVAGIGSDDSKVKRLTKAYNQLSQTGQSGQN